MHHPDARAEQGGGSTHVHHRHCCSHRLSEQRYTLSFNTLSFNTLSYNYFLSYIFPLDLLPLTPPHHPSTHQLILSIYRPAIRCLPPRPCHWRRRCIPLGMPETTSTVPSHLMQVVGVRGGFFGGCPTGHSMPSSG